MTKWITALLLAAGLAGCATYEPVPKDYTGPTAVIADSGFSENGTKAQLFALMEVDGNRIGNAFGASASASHGRGASLTTVYPQRAVPARPMKLLIRASHATGMPIHAIASQIAGTFFSIDGTVDFTPEAGRRYVVRGELKKEKSSVWIEDAETGKPVSAAIAK